MPNKNVSIAHIDHDALRSLLDTYCMSAPLLVIGSGDAKKIKTTNTVTYCIDGVIYTKATAETVFTDTTVQAISTTHFYLLSVNAAGTLVITNGLAGEGLPDTPADYCPIGYVKVVTDATGTFVPATDDLSDAAVTDTYVDIARKPATVS